jgi:SAM-dependent methyltransferase
MVSPIREPSEVDRRPELPSQCYANFGKVTWAKRIAVEHCLSRRPKRVLDCPAQNVWLSEQLVAHGIACVAGDILYPQEPIIAADGLLVVQRADLNAPLPFQSEEFDAIICLEGIEHGQNPSLVLRELARCLRPGGAAFLSCPNILNIKSRLKYLLRGSFYSFPHLIAGEESPDGHIHITPTSYPMLEYLATSNGLKIAERYFFGVTRKYIPFLPLAGLVKALVHIGARFADSPKRRALQLELVSPSLLLADQLFLRLEKPK